jgi:hypothetical protein
MKGISGKTMLIAAAVIVGGFLLYNGGALAIYAVIVGPQNCDVAPDLFNCVCSEGYDKVRASAGPYSPGWIHSCVPELEPLPYSFPMDPDDPNFENKALAYAEYVLHQRFPDCNTVGCESPAYKDIFAMTGGGTDLGYVECLINEGPYAGSSYWRVIFHLEDGEMWNIREPVCRSI